MLVIPSIYIKDNNVFPLATGGSVFDPNPVEMAKKLADVGAEVVFISDLNCPPSGHVPHLGIIEEVAKQAGLKIFLTGNIRSEDVVEKYIGAGVEYVVMGPIAYQKPDFLKTVCEKFPSNIAAHIEVKAGKVSITGWAVATRKTDLDYAEQFRDAGVSLLLYSNAEADGKISLNDINNLSKFLIKSPLPVVQSAGINSISEIESILSLSSTKLIGTILGRSMYAGLIDVASTITHSKEKGPSGMGRANANSIGGKMSDCIFCKIINGEIPCDKVFESDKLIGFKDIHPAAPTHILFMPKKHYATLNDIPEKENQIMADITRAIVETAKKLGVDESGYRVITNVNRGAGQEVFHVHTHLLAGRALGKMG